MDYFPKIRDFLSNKSIVEIGCGQGEFLQFLSKKIDRSRPIVGFDPVFRGEKVEDGVTTYAKLYDFSIPGEVFVFRCVLNHFDKYKEFLHQLSLLARPVYALIEYPNREHILKRNLWSAIGYEHVHYFSSESWGNYNVLHSGSFGNNEWSYVVIELPQVRFGKTLSPEDSELHH